MIDGAARHHLRLMITINALSPWGSSQLPPNFNDKGGPPYHQSRCDAIAASDA